MLAELTKRWRLRLSALCAIMASLVLVDEIAKEGYAFDVSEIVSPALTHEKLFLALLALSILLGVRR